jgi:DNA gyrase/topoisomerase IV subunit B
MMLEDFFSDDEPVAVVDEAPVVKTKGKDTALRKDDIVELSDIEHVLKRPTIYIGNVKEELIPSYIYNAEDGITFQDINLNSGLLKIVSEIIDNGVDEAVRCQYKYATKIEVWYKAGEITTRDNGRGLPIEEKADGKYTPEVIYTRLKSGSNFNDSDRLTLGANGVGSSLTNIFSTRFAVDTANGSKRYTQQFANSFSVIGRPKIVKCKENYTQVTFTPNYAYFNLSPECYAQLPDLIYKRLVNLSFCFPEITFYFNDKKISAKSLKQFLTGIASEFEFAESAACRIGVFASETEFQHISYVNGLDTVRGGSHIEYVTSAIVDHLRAFIKKKHKLEVKPIDIKSKLFLMLSMRMIDAQFDGQTKERLTNTVSEFKPVLDEVLTNRFLNNICNDDGIILPIVEAYRLKLAVAENLDLAKMGKTKKKEKIDGYLPATGDPHLLFLTEGLSANALISSVLGRTNNAYLPLRGKPLNTLQASVSKIKDNVEIQSIITASGLRVDKDDQNLNFRDGIVFACDQDYDGQNIKGLALCIFHRYAKSLLIAGKIKFLSTPLLVGTKKGVIQKFFFDIPSYHQYLNANPDNTLDWSYRKGLGSWTPKSLSDLISKHGIQMFLHTFEYDHEADELLYSWMAKEMVNKRKEFLRGRSFDISGV